jgi:type III pantothenate kinase
MLLAIDAGNTNIVFALSRDGRDLEHVWRCRTDAARAADEYTSLLHPLFHRAGIEFDAVKKVIIASVVPDADFNLLRLCRDVFGCEPFIVNSSNVPLSIALPRPQEAGADRLVNACAAIRDYGAPAIVIDFGTATTFDVVDSSGAFCGGVIAPGINLSLAALKQAAAKLPRIDVVRPARVIGTDTVSAMQAGIYWGYVDLVGGLLKRIADELGAKPRVIATGGLAPMFAEAIPAIEKVDPDLTLRGLLHIYSSRLK